jgi:hypothetical protein
MSSCQKSIIMNFYFLNIAHNDKASLIFRNEIIHQENNLKNSLF